MEKFSALSDEPPYLRALLCNCNSKGLFDENKPRIGISTLVYVKPVIEPKPISTVGNYFVNQLRTKTLRSLYTLAIRIFRNTPLHQNLSCQAPTMAKNFEKLLNDNKVYINGAFKLVTIFSGSVFLVKELNIYAGNTVNNNYYCDVYMRSHEPFSSQMLEDYPGPVAEGAGSTAIGDYAKATGDGSKAIGYKATAIGEQAKWKPNGLR